MSDTDDPALLAVYEKLREIAKEFGPVTVRPFTPDARKPDRALDFPFALDPIMGEGIKKGEVRIIVAKGRGESMARKAIETEHVARILGELLYRHSPTYAYDNASMQDALHEAREIVTNALKGQGS